MKLTPHQKIIIKLLSEGNSEKEIGVQLKKAKTAINNQTRNARAANNAKSTIHLVSLAIKNNLI
jgi:DNA-binding CsgD family transcriptional regulator